MKLLNLSLSAIDMDSTGTSNQKWTVTVTIAVRTKTTVPFPDYNRPAPTYSTILKRHCRRSTPWWTRAVPSDGGAYSSREGLIVTLIQRDKLATGTNRQSVLLFATHDGQAAGAHRPTTAQAACHVADLTRVNFVIASHMTIMFCQRRVEGRFKPSSHDRSDSATVACHSLQRWYAMPAQSMLRGQFHCVPINLPLE